MDREIILVPSEILAENSVMALRAEQLSFVIIGKAMEVHRELGPGVDEIFYHELLSERLRAAGIEHLFKPREKLIHRGHTADIFEPDLVVPHQLILELKWLWADFARESFVQLKCYLKFWRILDGLLLDFGKESLVQKRYIYTDTPAPPVDVAHALADAPGPVRQLPLARQLCEAVVRIAAGYGLSYRDTTYRGLLDAEFRAEGIGCHSSPVAAVHTAARCLGETRLPCLAVENQCALMILSQRDDIRAADRAILQSWLRHLRLPWGLIVHCGRQSVELRWVTAPIV